MKSDHLKMLCDIGELNQLFAETDNTDAFLYKIVSMVSVHMQTTVCSIYVYDEGTECLSIKATVGLNADSSKGITLKLGEGLAGKTLKEFRPMCFKRASQSPDYKFFPGLLEEKYDAFLSVPICQGFERIGVLVVQRDTKYPFCDEDVSALKIIASQLAQMILHVRTLMTIQETKPSAMFAAAEELVFIKGKGASHGFAVGEVRIVKKEGMLTKIEHERLKTHYDAEAFSIAVRMTSAQLEELQQKVEERLSDTASLIFTAHLLMLKDEAFTGEIMTLIEEGINAPLAIVRVAKKYIALFEESENLLLKEKAEDIADLATRLLHNVLGKEDPMGDIADKIVIARELFPSDILKFSSEDVRGIILISGGITSHLSILARSLTLPLVIADNPELLDLVSGTPVLIDGVLGNIYVHPTCDIVETFVAQQKAQDALMRDTEFLSKPTCTFDGERVSLLANINLLSDLSLARDAYTDGIGLYRSEFPFMIRDAFPSEEEQYVIYRKLIEGMPGKPITFRTLDIGGDKLLSYYEMHEQNPFLGFRSIRFSLQHTEVFIAQLRAILRAAVDADVRIMFPMISSLDELLAVRTIIADCKAALKKEKVLHNNHPKLGIMVEIPSVISILDALAPHTDFFSIGTNDLIQFVLAVDRTNEKVASFYNPLHPAILRTLNKIVSTANEYGVDVSLCGDMAHNETYIPFLLGIGLRSLSVDPIFVARIKKTIREIDMKDAELFAAKLLRLNTIREIEVAVKAYEGTKA